jgi:hypothetical protein
LQKKDNHGVSRSSLPWLSSVQGGLGPGRRRVEQKEAKETKETKINGIIYAEILELPEDLYNLFLRKPEGDDKAPHF